MSRLHSFGSQNPTLARLSAAVRAKQRLLFGLIVRFLRGEWRTRPCRVAYLCESEWLQLHSNARKLRPDIPATGELNRVSAASALLPCRHGDKTRFSGALFKLELTQSLPWELVKSELCFARLTYSARVTRLEDRSSAVKYNRRRRG